MLSIAPFLSTVNDTAPCTRHAGRHDQEKSGAPPVFLGTLSGIPYQKLNPEKLQSVQVLNSIVR